MSMAARVKGVTYGGPCASVVAGQGGYTLGIRDLPYDTMTKKQMAKNIERLMDDLRDIKFELERSYGVFHDLLEDEEDESIRDTSSNKLQRQDGEEERPDLSFMGLGLGSVQKEVP